MYEANTNNSLNVDRKESDTPNRELKYTKQNNLSLLIIFYIVIKEQTQNKFFGPH